jgi:hypothetical protein
MEKEYINAIDTINSTKEKIHTLKIAIDDATWSQYIELHILNTMHYLRTKFMFDNDIDFLRRGVTWTQEYAEKLRKYRSNTSIPTKRLETGSNSYSAW